MTKTLGRRILASGEFVGQLAPEWDSLGEHQLAGVGKSDGNFLLRPSLKNGLPARPFRSV